jgi:transcriptional regulator with XRE-family HTH domain
MFQIWLDRSTGIGYCPCMNNRDRSLRTRLAEELRAEMARQGMSHRRMAELIGRPHNTVSYGLNGESAIDPDILESMCNALGMETPDLYAAARRNGGWTIQMPPVRLRPTAKARAGDNQQDAGRDTHGCSSSELVAA